MIREFDEEDLEHAERGRDTELTLGAGMLLVLGCGLLLLCCFCFGLGYVVGHRVEAPSSSDVLHGGAQSAHASGGSKVKPMAGAQTPTQPPPARVAVAVPDNAEAAAPQNRGAVSAAAISKSAEEQPQAAASLHPQVKPALAGQGSIVQAAQPASTLHVQPALSQAQGWMVQIAAVSHVEDAEVLVNALRKRGYTVSVRRDIADTLLHVQTGPFVNRNDANAMRQRLLNDGYNAIVQP